MTFNFTLFL